ncbi:hypothetical protein B5M42_021835 [Paenibacillus athensensis]|uniref:Butirosin biosynthesis protein H N-terminal domain-containing protein n=1 Tax=Paenibacillus athensensis TaxID=1967502 RepID=A0A4Y8PWI2_9BACL|nr:BtrH N-terminal domain-containing protein [Paenibacillus athensensis]MCD1261447.1 hypothetical protein [Paenibacillus athensensis]
MMNLVDTLIDLNPIKTGGDCFDDVIVTVDSKFQLGYRMMYAEALRFAFDNSNPEQTIGARMQTNFLSYFRLLKQYSGYSLYIHRNLTMQEGLQKITEQLAKGNPIGLFIDSFYNPWDIKFQREHFLLHAMLVVGFNSATHALICVDPFFEQKNVELPFELFEQGYHAVMTIEPGEPDVKNAQEAMLELRKQLEEVIDIVPQGFTAFRDAFPTINFAEEMRGLAQFGESLLFIRFNSIVNGRRNYANMLEYLAVKYNLPKLNDFAEQLRKIGNEWNIVRGFITKMNVLARNNNHHTMMSNLQDKITANIEAETALLHKLKEALAQAEAGNDISVALPSEEQAANLTVTSVEHLDISHLFTVRGFDNADHTADFDTENYYYSREDLPADHILRTEDMSFYLPALLDEPFDNLVSLGQVIELPEGPYRGFLTLGSSDMGSYFDVITVEYTDGTSEQLTYGFPDWWAFIQMGNERVALKTGLYRRGEGKLNKEVCLFANKSVFTPGKTAKRLILPTMPNIHLFALSLWS